MTRIEKSEEQLNAEASLPLEERDLDQAIAAHRLAYKYDAGILKMHARDGDDAGLGPPFNPIFAAFLDEENGWNAALSFMRTRFCRADHPEHWSRPEWRGSLCYALTSLVIRQERELSDAMAKLGLTHEGKTRRVLHSSLLVIEKRILERHATEKSKQAQPPREPVEWMSAPHEHRHPPGSSTEDCPQCQRRAAA